MANITIQDLPMQTGAIARVLTVALASDADKILSALEIPPPRAVAILNGGTASLAEPLKSDLEKQIADGLARVASEEQITLVTGATDAGVFGLLGQGIARWDLHAPCIGVAVAAQVRLQPDSAGEAPLEQHHTHFVLVHGQAWGDETNTMYDLVSTLARQCPSVAIYAGGGPIVVNEMEANIRQGRPMILLAGSGRTTDAVLAAYHGQISDERITKIAKSGLVVPFDIQQEPDQFAAKIRHILFG